MAKRRGKPKTAVPGSSLLLAFLDEHKIPYELAGESLGVTGAAVFDWAKGKKRPIAIHREAIEKWTSGRVKESAWALAGEESNLRAVRPYGATRRTGSEG